MPCFLKCVILWSHWKCRIKYRTCNSKLLLNLGRQITHYEANETSLLTVPSDLRRRFILSPRPPTGSFTVCVFCNDRHEIAGWCEHILAVINLQQQAVGTPCQQKWHFPDKGLTPNCLQKWHMYHIMVIHLGRTETLLLIYHPLKWFKTDGAPAVRTPKTATCAPENPEHTPETELTYRPCDLHGRGADHHGVVHVDHHVPKLLLHATVVHSLCCGADV